MNRPVYFRIKAQISKLCKLHRSSIFILSMIMLLVCPALSAAAAENSPEPVRVGWYEDSYHITGENGERSGYGYEYEQSVAAYTGWTYDYVEGEWSELLDMLQSGGIDIMAAVSYTDERAEKMLFSELPMGEEKFLLYADLNGTDISPSELDTLNGKKIAMLEQSVQTDQFNEWEEKHGISTQHIYITSVDEVKKLLNIHEIDGVISSETPIWSEEGMSAIAVIGGSESYYGINKNRPDIKAQLDDAMRSVDFDNPFYTDELYKKYLSSQSVSVLTAEEKNWLDRHGNIRVGWVKNDDGVSTINPETGELSGIISDYTAYAHDCLSNQNLNFDLHGFDSIDEEIAALKDGRIDMIFHSVQNPYIAEQNDLSLSDTTWTINAAAITADDHFNENAENTAAVARDDFAVKWYISYNYPKWKLIEFDTDKEVEKAVLNGQADCFVIRSGQVAKYIKNHKLHSMFLMQPSNTAFAVKRGNPVLLSILNKTLKSMPASMMTGAISMYDSTSYKVTLADYLKDNLPVVAAVFISVFVIILLAILKLLKKSRIAEDRAKKAMEQAENANAAKSAFLFNMSHDIRTPMNAILGFASLAGKNPDNPPMVQDYLRKIEVSGQGMLSILNNVLELSRIEAGKTTLEETPQVAGSAFDSCMVMMNPEIEKHHHTVTVEKKIEHKYIYFDATRITEIILNILSNAIKYTADGGNIHCVLEQFPHPEEGWVYQGLSVTDNGIGMSEEFQKHMFETFARERSSTVSGIQGTGLGMDIVKKLIDLMHGNIDVRSKLGEGTTVAFRIPVRIASYEDTQPKHSAAAVDTTRLRGKRVLLAEDNELNAEIAIALLKEEGLIVDRVSDGVQCVEKIESCDAGFYDLILMDVQMPSLDGYMTTEKIRKLNDKAKASIPIIAMTANAFSEDKIKAIDSGMNDHIAKPIDMGVLVRVLLKYI